MIKPKNGRQRHVKCYTHSVDFSLSATFLTVVKQLTTKFLHEQSKARGNVSIVTWSNQFSQGVYRFWSQLGDTVEY